MPTFTDINDREWRIEFDGVLLDDVLTETGVDLGDENAAGLAVAATSPVKLIKVLTVLCREEYIESRITARQFSKGIRSDAIDRARDALLQAAEVFFPPSRWSAIQSRLKTTIEIDQAWIEAHPIFSKLNDPTTPPEFREGMIQQLKESFSTEFAPAASPSASGPENTPRDSAISSQESAESAPAD